MSGIREKNLRFAICDWRLIAVLAVLLLCNGCETKQQTYNAPDPTAVREKTRLVKEGVRLSRFDVEEARKHIEAAQNTADALSTLSLSLLGKVDALAKDAPIELQKPIGEIRLDVVDLQENDKALASILVNAWDKNDAAQKHLVETDAREAELEQKQREYYENAQKLADKATDENAHRIKAEKKLSWYRWHFWGSWIALGSGVIACAVAAFLKWGTKWGAKLGVAAAKVGI